MSDNDHAAIRLLAAIIFFLVAMATTIAWAVDTVGDYAAFEFSPEVADDVTSAVALFEKNHFRNRIGKSAVAACQLIERADAKLTPQARSAWRWRLFRIRAAIDQEMYRNTQGQGREKVFRQAYEELMKISRAENAMPMLRPALIPAITRRPGG